MPLSFWNTGHLWTMQIRPRTELQMGNSRQVVPSCFWESKYTKNKLKTYEIHLWSLLQSLQCQEANIFLKNGILKNLSLKKLLSSHHSILFLCWILTLVRFLSLHSCDETEAPQKEQRQDLADINQGELYNEISWPSGLLRVNT